MLPTDFNVLPDTEAGRLERLRLIEDYHRNYDIYSRGKASRLWYFDLLRALIENRQCCDLSPNCDVMKDILQDKSFFERIKPFIGMNNYYRSVWVKKGLFVPPQPPVDEFGDKQVKA